MLKLNLAKKHAHFKAKFGNRFNWSDPWSDPHGSNPHGSNPHESNPQNKFKEIAHFEAKWGLELLVENLWKIFKNL